MKDQLKKHLKLKMNQRSKFSVDHNIPAYLKSLL